MKGEVMYVAAIHEISNPEAFWGGQLDLPQGTALRVAVPSADGKRGVCVFTSDSVDTVRAIVDGAKVHDYLLSPEHPVGRFKAVFFGTLGYTRSMAVASAGSARARSAR